MTYQQDPLSDLPLHLPEREWELVSTEIRGPVPGHHHRPASSVQVMISNAWCIQWLDFVHRHDFHIPRHWRNEKKTQRPPQLGVRAPGPIANLALVNVMAQGQLELRQGLKETQSRLYAGDYRVISQELWLMFHMWYGGGPVITLEPQGGWTIDPITSNDLTQLGQLPKSNEHFFQLSKSEQRLMLSQEKGKTNHPNQEREELEEEGEEETDVSLLLSQFTASLRKSRSDTMLQYLT